MSVWLVMVRSLRDGKSRLAPALDLAQRALSSGFVHTLEQAAESLTERTLVVSPCEEARACGELARVLNEQAPSGLNQALRQSQCVERLDATQMLMVASAPLRGGPRR
jgi:2-phospho-L-lactate guanylyltransferase (CobY/MobA/RfbA family)